MGANLLELQWFVFLVCNDLILEFFDFKFINHELFSFLYSNFQVCVFDRREYEETLLLTWINFNLSIEK